MRTRVCPVAGLSWFIAVPFGSKSANPQQPELIGSENNISGVGLGVRYADLPLTTTINSSMT